MLRRMDSRELSEWMAFYSVEPFGGDADYFGSAIVASTVANSSPNRKKGSKATKPADFIPKFEKQTQSIEQMIQLAETFTIGLGGQDLRQEQETGENG